MSRSAARRVIGQVAVSVVSWGLPIAATVVTTPWLWRELGAAGYGQYVFAIGYAAFAGALSSTRGVARAVTAVRARQDPEALGRVAGSAYLASAIAGAVLAVALVSAAPLITGQLDLAPAERRDAIAMLRIAALAAPFALIMQAAWGILLGCERFTPYALHASVTAVAGAAGAAWLAVRGHGVITLVAWQTMLSAISAAAAVAIAAAAGRHGLAAPRWIDAWEITRFNTAVWIAQIASSVWLLTERTVVTRAIGLPGLPEFSVPLTLAALMQSAAVSGALILLPRSADLWTRADTLALRRTYAWAVKVIAVVAAGGTAMLAALAAPALGWWIEPAFGARAASVLGVLAAAFCVNAITVPVWYIAEGGGQPSRNAVISIVWAIAGTAACVLLAPALGAEGAALARVAAMLLAPWYVVRTERALLGAPQRALWSRIARHVLPAAFGLALALKLALPLVSRVVPASPVGLLAVACACAAAYLWFLWRSPLLSDDERHLLVHALTPAATPLPAADPLASASAQSDRIAPHTSPPHTHRPTATHSDDQEAT